MSAGRFKRVLKYWDLFLFNVCAIIVLDTVASSAAIGMQTFFWWFISLFLFFIPYGLITAELGSAWPSEGGIYVWVKEAFGEKLAVMTSWLYWVNVALWMPSVYVLFSGTLSKVFAPDLDIWSQTIIAIVMIWITVAAGILELGKSKWIPNIGAVVKAFVLVSLGILGVYWIFIRGFANPFTASDLLPSWSTTLAYLPVIVYNYMGFELASSAGEEIVDPKRDVPKAIVFAGAAIFILYVLGTFGLLAVLPLDKLSIVTGIIDAITEVSGLLGPSGEIMIVIFGILILYTFFTNMVTWTIGANRVVASTSQEGLLPKSLGHLHGRYMTPDYAYYLTGIIGTVLLLGNAIPAESIASIFWTIFALSSLIFLIPYLFLFPAFIKLRYSKPEVPRPYTVPGGRIIAWISAVLGEIFIAMACLFFFKPPEEITDVVLYEAQLIGITALVIVVGYLLYVWSKRRYGS
jgi:amino acid transporter